jgi:hypothetical protein
LVLWARDFDVIRPPSPTPHTASVFFPPFYIFPRLARFTETLPSEVLC